MELLEEFQTTLNRLNKLGEAKTAQELVVQLALISEAIEKCEKLLMYMATSSTGREDMITYLFEYKQLINLQLQLEKLKLPEEIKPEIVIKKQPWWKRRST